MIVTCPSCTTQFMVDSGALAPDGRKVRCGRCSHLWHQTPLPLPLADEPLTEHPLPPEDPLPEDHPLDDLPLEDLPLRAPRPLPNLPALRDAARPRSAVVGWSLLVVIMVVLVSFLWFGREPLVAAWPTAARAYALVGIEASEQLASAPVAPPPGLGLELRDITPVRLLEDGISYLVLEGVVVNTTADQRPVPAMVAVLRGPGAETLQRWTLTVAAANLGPNESVPFSTRLANPSDEIIDIKLDFSDEVP